MEYENRDKILRVDELDQLFPKPDNYDDIRADIKKRGIQEPLVINQNKSLVCGYTRLDIADDLSIDKIPVRIIEFDDILLMKEYALKDNFHRRQLSKLEQVELCGIPLEKIEKEKAERRMKLGKKLDEDNPMDIMSTGSKGTTRDAIGNFIGMSGKTYDRWKIISEEASDTTKQYLKNGVLNQNTALDLCKKLPKEKQDKLLKSSKSAFDSTDIRSKIHKLRATEQRIDYEEKTVMRFFEKYPEFEKYKEAVFKKELETGWHDEIFVPEETLIKGSFTGMEHHFPKYSGQKASIFFDEDESRTYPEFESKKYPKFTEKEWNEVNEYYKTINNHQATIWNLFPDFSFEKIVDNDGLHETSVTKRKYDHSYGHKILKDTDVFGDEIYIKQGWGEWLAVSFNDGTGHRIHRRFFRYDHLFKSLIDHAIKSTKPDMFSEEDYRRLKIHKLQELNVSWFYLRKETVGIDDAIKCMEEDLHSLRQRKKNSISKEEAEKKTLEYLKNYIWAPLDTNHFREGVQTLPRKSDGTLDKEKYEKICKKFERGSK